MPAGADVLTGVMMPGNKYGMPGEIRTRAIKDYMDAMMGAISPQYQGGIYDKLRAQGYDTMGLMNPDTRAVLAPMMQDLLTQWPTMRDTGYQYGQPNIPGVASEQTGNPIFMSQNPNGVAGFINNPSFNFGGGAAAFNAQQPGGPGAAAPPGVTPGPFGPGGTVQVNNGQLTVDLSRLPVDAANSLLNAVGAVLGTAPLTSWMAGQPLGSVNFGPIHINPFGH